MRTITQNRYGVIDTLLAELLMLLKNSVEILKKSYYFVIICGIMV